MCGSTSDRFLSVLVTACSSRCALVLVLGAASAVPVMQVQQLEHSTTHFGILESSMYQCT